MGLFRNGLGVAALGLMLSASGSVAATSALQPGAAVGTWVNPKGTVKVTTSACGKLLCGTVVSASPDAQAAAQKAGAPPLVGSKLLRDYRQTGKDKWQGKVFVPDRNASYYSTIKQLNANQLKISGCILGGLLCKSQVWTRVS
jgi:uncharacterized protein (DUF2147 family)